MASAILITCCLMITAGVIVPSADTDKAFSRRVNIASSLYGFSPASLDTLGQDEREAMKWLYAYMQTPDITAYAPEFFLANVRSSLKAKRGDALGQVCSRTGIPSFRIAGESE